MWTMTFFNVFFLGFYLVVFAEPQPAENVKQSFENMLKDIIEVNQGRMATLKKLMQLEDIVVTRADLRYLNNEESDMSADDEARHGAIMAILDFLYNQQNRRAQPPKEDPVNILNKRKPLKRKERIPINETSAESNIENSKENTPSVNIPIVQLKAKNKEKILNENEIIEDNDKYSDSNTSMLRKSWIKTVKKRGSKTCIKACKAAHKNFCRLYSCSRRAKRTFRKECKLNCKAKFRGQYDDEE